jgi:soluble lytic murein transglycosylase-like protein
VTSGIEDVRERVAEIRKGFAVMRAAHRAVTFRSLVRAAAERGRAPDSDRFDAAIARAAQTAGVEAALIKAVVAAESGFNPHAVSRAGARGLMQLMPATAAALGVSDPFDPQANLIGGARYMRRQLDRFGSLPLALAAYNAGPGAVARYGDVPPYPETQHFVGRVLDLLDTYRGRQ